MSAQRARCFTLLSIHWSPWISLIVLNYELHSQLCAHLDSLGTSSICLLSSRWATICFFWLWRYQGITAWFCLSRPGLTTFPWLFLYKHWAFCYGTAYNFMLTLTSAGPYFSALLITRIRDVTCLCSFIISESSSLCPFITLAWCLITTVFVPLLPKRPATAQNFGHPLLIIIVVYALFFKRHANMNYFLNQAACRSAVLITIHFHFHRDHRITITKRHIQWCVRNYLCTVLSTALSWWNLLNK